MERIVLAYSGGLDTSVAIAWLAEKYDAEVIAVTLDLGQGRELTDVRERALAVGAARAHVLDVRDEFARDYILPALQAGALYEDRYPLATALGRPLIARKLVEVARMEGASDHRARLQRQGERRAAPRARRPRARSVDARPRAGAHLGHVARTRRSTTRRRGGSRFPSTIDSPYTVDTNLWGRSIERGVLEDPWQESPEDIYALTRSPQTCPNEPAYVEVEFERGVPVRANGIEMPLVELIEIGRDDRRRARRRPHRHGRERHHRRASRARSTRRRPPSCSTPRTASSRSSSSRAISSASAHDLGRAYADLVYNGRWFSPTREAIDAFMRTIQPRVTGAVRLKLFKGDCRVVGRRSPMALDDDGSAAADQPAPSPSENGGSLMAHLWSGRFAGDPDAELFAFGSSFRFDRRLFEDDVRGQPRVGGGARARRRAVGGRRRGDRRRACARFSQKGLDDPALRQRRSTATKTCTRSSSAS